MKKGDKLYCKRNYFHNKSILYYSGAEYIIERIWHINDYEKELGRYWKDLSNESKESYVPSYWIEIMGTPDDPDKGCGELIYFEKEGKEYSVTPWDVGCFRSLKETRKLKLIKLNES